MLFDQLKEERFLSERALPSAMSHVRPKRADLRGRGSHVAADGMQGRWSPRRMPCTQRRTDSLFGVLTALHPSVTRRSGRPLQIPVVLRRLEYAQTPHEVLTPPPRSIAEVHPVRLLTRLGCADADADDWLYMCSYGQSRTLRP